MEKLKIVALAAVAFWALSSGIESAYFVARDVMDRNAASELGDLFQEPIEEPDAPDEEISRL